MALFLFHSRDAGLLSGIKWPADSAAPSALRRRPWGARDLSEMLTMNLEGLEMIAVLVVVVLFVKVLEQFGLLEASYDGKERANSFHFFSFFRHVRFESNSLCGIVTLCLHFDG
ncbi:hypothetical protein Q5P01_002736 [Channa striata]|uniref:Uncharacterized protein n=1 Tax=Channa striata TaxID=64152 RepID=A0AA88NTP6_CHASR|nr:hypothetical protein Q5P01_002736 [Channa striata]